MSENEVDRPPSSSTGVSEGPELSLDELESVAGGLERVFVPEADSGRAEAGTPPTPTLV